MINRLKLSILSNIMNKYIIILFIITMIGDSILLINGKSNYLLPISLSLVILLLFSMPILNNTLKRYNVSEFYFILPNTKKDIIIGEWMNIFLFHVIGYILWALELLFFNKFILAIPFLYVISMSFLLNSTYLMLNYFNFKVIKRIYLFFMYILMYIFIFFIYTPIENYFERFESIASEDYFIKYPFISLIVCIILSMIIMIITIKYSKTKHLLWSD